LRGAGAIEPAAIETGRRRAPARAVQGLVDAGFAVTGGLRADIAKAQGAHRGGGRFAEGVASLSATKAVDDADGFFTAVDRWIGRWVFSPISIVVLSIVTMAGVVATVTAGPRSMDFLSEAGSVPLLLLALIPANAIGAVLHEGAHGVAVKRFGRKVKRAGIGWFVITPVAFVDTSDMWLESRWRRALVSMAGPFMNLLLGGMAALVATTTDSSLVSALLWQAAIVSYYLAVINLNPLLEFDGYYILSDALDRPNLREDALRWLGTGFPRALRSPKLFRGHGVDVLYGVLAVLYLAVIVFFIVFVYRALIENLVAAVLPDAIADAAAWLLAGGLAALLLLALGAQLRGLDAPRH
jgi:putative peptide zinc metalloprotease protein